MHRPLESPALPHPRQIICPRSHAQQTSAHATRKISDLTPVCSREDIIVRLLSVSAACQKTCENRSRIKFHHLAVVVFCSAEVEQYSAASDIDLANVKILEFGHRLRDEFSRIMPPCLPTAIGGKRYRHLRKLEHQQDRSGVYCLEPRARVSVFLEL